MTAGDTGGDPTLWDLFHLGGTSPRPYGPANHAESPALPFATMSGHRLESARLAIGYGSTVPLWIYGQQSRAWLDTQDRPDPVTALGAEVELDPGEIPLLFPGRLRAYLGLAWLEADSPPLDDVTGYLGLRYRPVSRPIRLRMRPGDLSVTALYTSQVWRWGKLPGAELFDLKAGRRVFAGVNAALAVGHLLSPGRPRLRPGLLQRHLMIDRLLAEHQPSRLIELAAGLSRRGASLTADPEVLYVEVDLPRVVEIKEAALEATAGGRAVLARTNLTRVSADVMRDDLDLAPADAVVVEGLMMYLDPPSRYRLFSAVRRLLNDGASFIFDLVPPDELAPAGLVGRSLGRVMRRFTGGQGFQRDDTSREAVVDELNRAGFSKVRTFTPQEHPAEWALPHLGVATQQVVWHQIAGRNSSRRPDEPGR